MNKKRYILFYIYFLFFMFPIVTYCQFTLNYYIYGPINFDSTDILLVCFVAFGWTFSFFHNSIKNECVYYRIHHYYNNDIKNKNIKEMRKEIKYFFSYYENENFWVDLKEVDKKFKMDMEHIKILNFTGLIMHYKLSELKNETIYRVYMAEILNVIEQYLWFLPEGKRYKNKLKTYEIMDFDVIYE